MYKALTSIYDLWYMYRPASSDSILRGVIDISYSSTQVFAAIYSVDSRFIK